MILLILYIALKWLVICSPVMLVILSFVLRGVGLALDFGCVLNAISAISALTEQHPLIIILYTK